MRLILFIAILSVVFIQCNIAKTDEKIEFLESFYELYIDEISQKNMDIEKLDSLKIHYCSQKFLDNIKNIDYNPFIDAQDFYEPNLRRFRIEEGSDSLSYEMKYPITDVLEKVIFIRLIQINGRYFINEIR